MPEQPRQEVVLEGDALEIVVNKLLFNIAFFALMVQARGYDSPEAQRSWEDIVKNAYALVGQEV